MRMTFCEFYEYETDRSGYCPECDQVTRFEYTEPDITPMHGVPCPDCEAPVYGIEMAMVAGLIEIVEEDVMREGILHEKVRLAKESGQ
jgi:hypothetical protein